MNETGSKQSLMHNRKKTNVNKKKEKSTNEDKFSKMFQTKINLKSLKGKQIKELK